MKLIDIVNEYNVIGSAVRLDEIPKEYRGLKVLGRGATSIVLEKDPETVLMFTRDHIKVDYLRHGIKIISDINTVIPAKKFHHITGMKELPLYMVELPKLYPLSSSQKQIIKKEFDEFRTIYHEALTKGWKKDSKQDILNKLIEYYDKTHPDNRIHNLLLFLSNYDQESYQFDINVGQYKQTKSGEIVLLDPIVSKELMDLFMKKYH